MPRSKKPLDSLAADGSRLARWAPILAAAAAVVAYLPSLKNQFLYDDVITLVANPAIRDLSRLRVVLLYEPARPLLSLTWALNYAWSGLEPWSYHLVNLAIHAINALLVTVLFGWMGRRWQRPSAGTVALVAGVLFAVTPMAVETVAYVSSRSTALATLFALACLLVSLRALEAPARAWSRLPAALALFVLALGTKEEAFSIPLFLLLLDYFFVARPEPLAAATRGKEHGGPATVRSDPALFLSRGRFADMRARLAWHLPFWLLVAGVIARRALTGTWLPVADGSPWLYPLTQLAVFPLYCLRAALPLDPAFYRGYTEAAWPPSAVVWAGCALSCALGVAAFRLRRRRAELSLAIAWMAAGLLPSSSIVPLTEMVVDHRAYLGSAAILFALATLCRPRHLKWAALIMLLLLGRTYRYQWVLADPVRVWEDAIWRAPRSALAHRVLGEAYASGGDWRAERHLRQAVTLDPQDTKSWTNLGVFLVRAGRLSEGERATREALRLSPRTAQLHENLAMILVSRGRAQEAMAELEEALRLAPAGASPRLSLAALLLRQGRRERAVQLIDEAERLGPSPDEAEEIAALRRIAGAGNRAPAILGTDTTRE